MKVTVNINKLDLIWLNLVVLPRTKSTYIGILSIAVLVFALMCWDHGFPDTGRKWAIMLVASLAGGLLGMVFGLLISIVVILFSASTTHGVLGEHEYTITQEGLFERTSANEGLNRWEGISLVLVSGEYLLLQISAYLFHVIPSRSFASKQQFDDYASVASTYWQQMHNK